LSARKQGRKQAKRGPRSAPSPRLKQKRIWPQIKPYAKLLGQILGWLALGFGIFGGALLFQSRVSVTPSDPLDPNDPFTTTFTVTNEGTFPIYDVYLACEIQRVGNPPRNIQIINTRTALGAEDTIPVMRPDQATTTLCDLPFGFPDDAQPTAGDVEIQVEFDPKFLWRTTKEYRFTTVRTADGRLRWIPRAQAPERP
jgi:hypothetical protein